VTLEPKVISGPQFEPVEVNEAQLQTKADYLEEDALYSIWISAAREYVEGQAGITMHEKTLEITLDALPGCNFINLPRATPLIQIVSVTITDSSGVSTPWDSSNYIADSDTVPGRLVLASGKSWPPTDLAPVNGIRIRYRAGLENATPKPLLSAKMRHPVMLLVNAFDRNRSAETVPTREALTTLSLRFGVEAFIESIRVEPNNF